MEPPGGPPGDKRHPLPPPWGTPGKPGAAPAPTTLPGGHAGARPPTHGQPPAPEAGQPPAPAAYPPPPAPAAYPPPPAPAPYPPPPAPYPPSHGYPPPTGHTPPPEKLPPPPAPLAPLSPPVYPPPAQGYPPPPAQGYPPPPHAPPHGGTPLPLAPPPPDRAIAALPPPGHGFVDFLKISARRAVRLRIEPTEVLPQERAELLAVHPPVADPGFQAFLSWRRSILFVVACALVPLILLRIFELMKASDDPMMPDQLTTLQALPIVAEAIFCAIAFAQLKSWTRWQRQRKVLAYGFAAFFLAPFVIYLFPLPSFFSDQFDAARDQMMAQGMTEDQANAALHQARALVGVVMSVQAIMILAPKAISLMPGLIRASLVSKMLFPGLAAPGWLMVLAAPIYSLLVYVVLIMPYQITGSGWFVGAIVAIIAAQYFLGRAGFQLARPQSQDQAIATVRAARNSYLTSLVVGAGFIVIAFGANIDMLDLGVLSIVNLLLSFEVSVLALTLIITDAVIASLDHARSLTHGHDALEDASEAHIAAFVSAAHGDAAPPATAGPAATPRA